MTATVLHIVVGVALGPVGTVALGARLQFLIAKREIERECKREKFPLFWVIYCNILCRGHCPHCPGPKRGNLLPQDSLLSEVQVQKRNKNFT